MRVLIVATLLLIACTAPTATPNPFVFPPGEAIGVVKNFLAWRTYTDIKCVRREESTGLSLRRQGACLESIPVTKDCLSFHKNLEGEFKESKLRQGTWLVEHDSRRGMYSWEVYEASHSVSPIEKPRADC